MFFFDKQLINQKEAAQNDLKSLNYYVIILFWSTINRTGYKLTDYLSDASLKCGYPETDFS